MSAFNAFHPHRDEKKPPEDDGNDLKKPVSREVLLGLIDLGTGKVIVTAPTHWKYDDGFVVNGHLELGARIPPDKDRKIGGFRLMVWEKKLYYAVSSNYPFELDETKLNAIFDYCGICADDPKTLNRFLSTLEKPQQILVPYPID